TKKSTVHKYYVYVINGEKIDITNASFSNTITVTAVTGKDSRSKNIISAFIVPTNLKGLTITSDYDKMGVRGSDTTQIVLEDVVVPKDALLGDSEAGFKQFITKL